LPDFILVVGYFLKDISIAVKAFEKRFWKKAGFVLQ
jgi:hypothetical protein